MLWMAILALVGTLGATERAEVAAVVNGESISVRQLDAAAASTIDGLHARLDAITRRVIDRLIDERLRTQAAPPVQADSPPVPVAAAQIQALKRQPSADVRALLQTLPAAHETQDELGIIQYYLEKQARDSAAAESRRRLRAGHRIVVHPPEPAELERPPRPVREVAQVDGVPIQAMAIERGATVALYRVRESIYREQLQQLDRTIDETLLAQAAKQRGVTVAALLAAATMPSAAEGRERLIHGLRAGAQIEVRLRGPTPPALPTSEGDAPAFGAATGPRLIVYTNYHCADCRAAHAEVDRVRAVDADLRVVFRDFIPAYDPVASDAARLVRCAARWKAFEPMRRELLARPAPLYGRPWYTDDEVPRLAERLRVPAADFVACLSSPDVAAAIEYDTTYALQFGFEEPPVFIAEGAPLCGLQPAHTIRQTLQSRHH